MELLFGTPKITHSELILSVCINPTQKVVGRHMTRVYRKDYYAVSSLFNNRRYTSTRRLNAADELFLKSTLLPGLEVNQYQRGMPYSQVVRDLFISAMHYTDAKYKLLFDIVVDPETMAPGKVRNLRVRHIDDAYSTLAIVDSIVVSAFNQTFITDQNHKVGSISEAEDFLNNLLLEAN